MNSENIFTSFYQLELHRHQLTDLEASIDEQNEEFESFGKDRRHSIILRNLFFFVSTIINQCRPLIGNREEKREEEKLEITEQNYRSVSTPVLKSCTIARVVTFAVRSSR